MKTMMMKMSDFYGSLKLKTAILQITQVTMKLKKALRVLKMSVISKYL